MERRRFVRFVMTGGVAAAVNLVSRYILNFWMSFSIAVVAAYLCGMTTAYVLNKLFVFDRSGRSVANEFWRFTLVNLVAVLQVWVISVGLGEYVFPAIGFERFHLLVAHAIGVSVPIVTSYLGHRHFSFAKASGARDPSIGDI